MEKNLILPRYKNDLLYIVLISVIVYIGSYFTGDFFPGSGIFNKVLCHILLVLSAGIVYLSIEYFTSYNRTPFLGAVLYLLIPSHFDYFLFTYQLQLLLAEFFLLVSFYSFLKGKDREAFIWVAVVIMLNAKLIVLYLPFLYFKKSSMVQKMFIFAHVVANVIFYGPYFRYAKSDLIFNPRNFFYSLENLFSPVPKSVVDLSLLIPAYYDKSFIVVLTCLFLLISIFYFNKKILLGKIIASFTICSILSTFIPINYFFINYDSSIYASTNAYPLIQIAVLILLLMLIIKSRVGLIIALTVSSLWIVKDFKFQKSTINVVNHWNEIIYSMPESINNEEKVKLIYVDVLMANKEYETAEKYVNQARYKFPNETWYNLAHNLAARRQDQKVIDNLQDELYQYKVPFHVD